MANESPKETDSSGRIDWSKKHLWQIQWVRDLLLIFAAFGLLLLGERLSLVTVPAMLAMLFAYLFEPLIVRLCRLTKISRGVAASGIIISTVVLVVIPILVGIGFGILQGSIFANRIAIRTAAVVASTQSPEDEELRKSVGTGTWLTIRDNLVELNQDAASSQSKETKDDATEDLTLFGIDRQVLAGGLNLAMGWVKNNTEQTARTLSETIVGTSRGALTAAVSTITSFSTLLFGAFLTAFFFFFISSAWPDIVADSKSHMPDEDRDKWLRIIAKMDRAVHGFVRGRLTIAFVLGIFYTVGFWLIGVPAPLIAGPAVAILTLIPYAALLLVPIVMVFLWLEHNTGLRGTFWWIVLAPLVLYQVGQMLDDYVLTPMIQGKSTNLDTPTILFASIAGGILLGFFGLLVAIPLAACAKILFNEVLWPRIQAWLRGQAKDPIPLDH